jgi:single-strand DNA-binding protein
VVEKYEKKGTQVYIEGRLRSRSWGDQNGNKRYVTEIVADTRQLLGRRPEGQQQGGYQQQAPQGYQQPGVQQQPTYQQPGVQQQPTYQQPVQQAQPKPAVDDLPEDDLPF